MGLFVFITKDFSQIVCCTFLLDGIKLETLACHSHTAAAWLIPPVRSLGLCGPASLPHGRLPCNPDPLHPGMTSAWVMVQISYNGFAAWFSDGCKCQNHHKCTNAIWQKLVIKFPWCHRIQDCKWIMTYLNHNPDSRRLWRHLGS